MTELTRCKYCGDMPTSTGWGSGSWSYTCNCIFWQSNHQVEYWSTDELAVRHWNKMSGVGPVEKEEKEPETEPACKCQSRDLLWYGCRCNYAVYKHKNKTC